MIKIIQGIGPQKPQVFNFIKEDGCRKYCMTVNDKKTTTSSLATTFAMIDPSMLDLLVRMLSFNPKDRISVIAALQHPLFEKFDKSNYMPPKTKIKIVMDDEKCRNKFDLLKQLENEIKQVQ